MFSVSVAPGPVVGVELALALLVLVLVFVSSESVLSASANYIRSNSHISYEQEYVQSVIRIGTKVAIVSLLSRRALSCVSQRYSFLALKQA